VDIGFLLVWVYVNDEEKRRRLMPNEITTSVGIDCQHLKADHSRTNLTLKI